MVAALPLVACRGPSFAAYLRAGLPRSAGRWLSALLWGSAPPRSAYRSTWGRRAPRVASGAGARSAACTFPPSRPGSLAPPPFSRPVCTGAGMLTRCLWAAPLRPTGCGWSHLCAAAVRPCLVVALGRPPPTGCGGSPFGAVWVTLTLFPHLTLRQGHPLRDAVVPSFFTMRIALTRSPLAFVFCTFTGPPPTGCGATPLLYHCFVFLGSVVSCTCSIYSFPRVLHC